MEHLEFEYTQEQLSYQSNHILERALSLGATSAQVEINENFSTSVEVLHTNVESFETSYTTELNLSVYIDRNRSHISISQITPNNLDSVIKQALNLAKYTQEDPYNGIADKNLLCNSFKDNLQLYNPITISNQDLINKAKHIEELSLKSNHKQINSDGASLHLGKYNFNLANTNGLNLGYQTTRYSNSLSLIGQIPNSKEMQTDYWSDSARDFNDLISDNQLATITLNRTLRRLNKGKIKSGKYPVIFETNIAKSMIANFLNAISGHNIYRQLSFLNNSIGQQIFPQWLDIDENPFVIKGSSSCYFDSEGVNVRPKSIVTEGCVNNYLLNCYYARKLNLESTGNAGGWHNIKVSHNFEGDLNEFAKTLGKGLIIIDTIGHGLNMVSGDYSVGASGLWVENGEIKFFVDNFSIAGNLKQIYQNIHYISNDWNSHSSIWCGSILADGITVST